MEGTEKPGNTVKDKKTSFEVHKFSIAENHYLAWELSEDSVILAKSIFAWASAGDYKYLSTLKVVYF